jgi:hypothetical protein
MQLSPANLSDFQHDNKTFPLGKLKKENKCHKQVLASYITEYQIQALRFWKDN